MQDAADGCRERAEMVFAPRLAYREKQKSELQQSDHHDLAPHQREVDPVPE
jgi:hypothetical protein